MQMCSGRLSEACAEHLSLSPCSAREAVQTHLGLRLDRGKCLLMGRTEIRIPRIRDTKSSVSAGNPSKDNSLSNVVGFLENQNVSKEGVDIYGI